ncbi:MAG: serine/threonine protein kinase, partial [Planctomycetes bacterium]|nr:serine/threonine protein kinase [Planctomycetota bacterium]
LCEDLDLRSRAAVKVLHTRNADARRRFVEEATLLANLRHPHLVQVLAVGEAEDGSPYMAMEHLGRSLDRGLIDGEPLPWREVVEIAVQVADALTALHRAGVVHRDVKPSNIAELRGVTGRVFVKLIDLGVARVDDLTELQTGGDPLPPRRPTEVGKVVGTPGFVPPEAGLCPATPIFDVYGLGVTIFRLCTGV